MKTEAQIRMHLDFLLCAMEVPCGCAGTEHAQECYEGKIMMRSAIDILSWALGENEPMQDLLDSMAKELRDVITPN